MKRLILALLLFLTLSIGFSDAVSDFVASNINLILATFTFVLVFGISMGAASMWTDKSEQSLTIAAGFSILVSFFVLIFPNLLEVVLSVLKYSPIFLVIFIIIFLIIVIIYSKAKPWQRILAAALLIAAIGIIIYLSWGEITGGSWAPSAATGTGFNWAPLVLFGIALLIAAVWYIKNKFGLGAEGSFISGGASASLKPIPAISSSKERKIKVLILEKQSGGNYTAINNDSVTLNSIPYNLTANNALSITISPTETRLRIEITGDSSRYKFFYRETARSEKRCKVKKAEYSTLNSTTVNTLLGIITDKEVKKCTPLSFSPPTTNYYDIDKKYFNEYNILLIFKSEAAASAPRSVELSGQFLSGTITGAPVTAANNIKLKFKIGVNNYEYSLTNPSPNTARDFSNPTLASTPSQSQTCNASFVSATGTFSFKFEGTNELAGEMTDCSLEIIDASGSNYSPSAPFAGTFTIPAAPPALSIINTIKIIKPLVSPNSGKFIVNVSGMNENIKIKLSSTTGAAITNTPVTGTHTFTITTPAAGIEITQIEVESITSGIKNTITLSPSVTLMPSTTHTKNVLLGAHVKVMAIKSGAKVGNVTVVPKIVNPAGTFNLYTINGTRITPLETNASGILEGYANPEPMSPSERFFEGTYLGEVKNSTPNFSFTAHGDNHNDEIIDFAPSLSTDAELNITVTGPLAADDFEEDVTVEVKNNAGGAQLAIGTTSNTGVDLGKVELTVSGVPATGLDCKIILTKGQRKFTKDHVIIQIGNNNIDLKLSSAVRLNAAKLNPAVLIAAKLDKINGLLLRDGTPIPASPAPLTPITPGAYYDIYFNTPIDKDIELNYEGVTKVIKINEPDNGKAKIVETEFPTQLKVVVVEKTAPDTFKVVAKDDDITYGTLCINNGRTIPSSWKYDVSVSPHRNYFYIYSGTNFTITLSPTTHSYTKNTVKYKNDILGDCSLGELPAPAHFGNFAGNEAGINIPDSSPELQPRVGTSFVVNQSLFDKNYNFLIIVRENKHAKLTIIIKNPRGNPIQDVEITSITNNLITPVTQIQLYDNSANPIALPQRTNASGVFECYIEANRSNVELKIEAHKGALNKVITIPRRIINPGDDIIWP